MKKRASLLISGITTAALVVTAIGSFAAWDKLSDDTKDTMIATSGTPAILEVTGKPFEVKNLIPAGSFVGTNDATELNAEITTKVTSENKKENMSLNISAKPVVTVTAKEGGVVKTVPDDYKVVVQYTTDGTTYKDATVGTPFKHNFAQPLKVKLTFDANKPAATNIDSTFTGDNIKVNVTVTG
ncbi:MAG: hypothetical protein RR188_08005, partial [Eubacterium sp.]